MVVVAPSDGWICLTFMYIHTVPSVGSTYRVFFSLYMLVDPLDYLKDA